MTNESIAFTLDLTYEDTTDSTSELCIKLSPSATKNNTLVTQFSKQIAISSKHREY